MSSSKYKHLLPNLHRIAVFIRVALNDLDCVLPKAQDAPASRFKHTHPCYVDVTTLKTKTTNGGVFVDPVRL